MGVLIGMIFFVLLQLPKSFLRSDTGEAVDVDENVKVYTSISSHCAIGHGLDSFLFMEV